MKEQDNNSDPMERSIFRYILSHTKKDQIFLIILTLASMPLVYLSLEIPKIIINKAIGSAQSSYDLLGLELDQVQYLLTLSGFFLGLVIINGVMKYIINVYRGVLGERMLRRLRYTLYSRIMRFPLPHFKKVSSSEIIPMVTAETEPLGGFIGDSIALPVFQGGLLITYIYFIFAQDFWLGVAAIALYPPQIYLIPRLQKKVNELSRQRVQTVRKLADRVGETVNSTVDIRVNDTGHLERADISQRLGKIFHIRNEIYRRKFFIKFLNNFLGQLTPFFFYSIGGYLVITGNLSLGALVAVLAAYKDIGPPWKELLKFYQITEDIRVKYAQIIQQFEPANMFNRERHEVIPDEFPTFSSAIEAKRVTATSENQSSAIENIDFDISVNQHIGIYAGDADTAKDLAFLLAGVETPDSGLIKIDEMDLSTLPESILGRNIGLCSSSSYIFNRSVKDNLYYGLRHQPVDQSPSVALSPGETKESVASGNSTQNSDTDWVDYQLSGAISESDFSQMTAAVIDIVELKPDIMALALHSKFGWGLEPEFVETIVSARHLVREALQDFDDGAVIESFDQDKYSTNLTVAENLLFGIAKDPEVTPYALAQLPEVVSVLQDTGLQNSFCHIGFELTELMLELFRGVDAESELFSQFSFIEASRIEEYQLLVDKIRGQDLDKLTQHDQLRLISLTLQLCPAQHRLGLITTDIQQSIVSARQLVMEKLGQENDLIQFIDRDNFQYGMSVQENLLFGKIAFNKLHLQSRIDQHLNTLLDQHGIADTLLTLGLEYNCGNAGSRVSQNFRRKLALARSLIKNPDILIVNDALATLDVKSQKRIIEKIKTFRQDKNIIWTLLDLDMADLFDDVLTLEQGRLQPITAPQFE